MKKKRVEKPKMYIVRKYIRAKDLKQAIRMEPKTAVHDCYIDADWKETHLADAIGFHEIEREEYEDDDWWG